MIINRDNLTQVSQTIPNSMLCIALLVDLIRNKELVDL